MGQKKDKRAKGSAKPPKTKCCVSKDRCQRCPLRMLKEGTLPDGYTVRKRKLVRSSARRARSSERCLTA